MDLLADREVQVLGVRALLERQVAAAEQVHRHVQRLLRVVIRLDRVARGHAVIGLDQVHQRLLELVLHFERDFFFAEVQRAEHVEDQHAVVRGDGAAAFRDDRRMLHADFVAHLLDVIDDVVGVFLQRVVHRRFEVRLRTVVIHAETAADVHELEAGALLGQLAVDAGRFVQRALDDADVRDLAAEMEVEELEAILHAALLQLFEAAQDLGDRQAELRAEAARRLPAPGSLGRELHAHADVRAHADLLGVLEHQFELAVLFDNRDDLAAHLLRQHRHLDEFEILEAVADDRRVVGGHRRHGEQFGLAAGFEAKAVLRAEVQHFLDDLALLVHLDRVNADVLALVLVLVDRVLKRAVDLTEPVLQDVGEADQDRYREAAQLQPVDETLQVDAAIGIFGGMDLQVALLGDREVALAPAGDIVEFRRFSGRPRARPGTGAGRQASACRYAHLSNKENTRTGRRFIHRLASTD